MRFVKLRIILSFTNQHAVNYIFISYVEIGLPACSFFIELFANKFCSQRVECDFFSGKPSSLILKMAILEKTSTMIWTVVSPPLKKLLYSPHSHAICISFKKLDLSLTLSPSRNNYGNFSNHSNSKSSRTVVGNHFFEEDMEFWCLSVWTSYFQFTVLSMIISYVLCEESTSNE